MITTSTISNMQTIKSVIMSYIVKIIAPESPAYGNTIPFVKQQSLQQIISTLQPGDIIFTKTNNTWYQACRKLLKTNYDHVSVVINKNEVIHISPPIISKLDINRIMVASRQPVIYRMDFNQKSRQILLNILTNYIGQKYNQSAIPTMLKNQLISRILQAQKDHEFTFQSLKYSKICTQAILYALCKAKQQLYNSITQFVQQKTQYKKIGFIMPDQFKAFLQQNKATIIHKSPQTTQKTLLTKLQQNIQSISQRISDINPIPALPSKQTLSVIKKLVLLSGQLTKKHPVIKTVSFLLFLYELKFGSKFNKILVIYSILTTLMLFRAFPNNISAFVSNKNSKL